MAVLAGSMGPYLRHEAHTGRACDALESAGQG
jgi:hypothetical protein